ncbi:MAG: PaaI family thioesterase [Proteobacteria bacterium]|nr:PaaI family thioesterase [Pseudomonadota bacterium]
MSADEIVNDEPDNPCFACSPHNPRGLKMRFRRAGGGAIECRYVAGPELAGFQGVVHGGIQATLLDDTMAFAARDAVDDHTASVVTVEMNLKYRRPVPVGAPLLVRVELERRKGRQMFFSGEIRSESGDVLTQAQARWMRLD